ncbi:MAG: hypothetical protein IJD90_02760 [Clostridia bacterium]|nr:hypothetical protein [Clostridia bacterium]
MKKIFPLSYKVNPEKPSSLVIIGLIYIIFIYVIRLVLSFIPIFQIVFNIISAVLTLYVMCALTVAILVYIKRV